MSKKVLLATEKPFARVAVEGIEEVFKKAGYDLVKLESYKTNDELLMAVADADAMIIRSDKATEEVLNAGKNLKIVVRAGAGYDNIDLAVATQNNIVAMNTPGQNSNAVAELAFAMMLYLARKGFGGKDGYELRGKKIGIHAYGFVGKYVALIAKGFGMDVYAFDPYVAKDKMLAEGVKPVDSVVELYSTCDYISLHLPKTKDTVKSINYDLMSIMKPNAVLVNTARAEVVCEESLLKIMAEKSGFAYATDVAPECKAVLEEKYAGRIFITPKKMGAQTEEANINAGIAAANQIVNFFELGDITYKVNK